MERRRRSRSRSPSQSRRSSLRGGGGSDKSSVPSTSGSGITKSKSKRGLSVLAPGANVGHGGVVGSKKERWLLTRKTWRYMTDAVGNLLPEYYYGTAAGKSGPGVVGTGLRRGSSSAGSGSGSSGLPTSATGTSAGPGPSTSSWSSYYGGTPTTTPTSGYTSYSLASPPFRQSVPRSSICSSSGTVPLVEEEELTPRAGTGAGAGIPGKIDVPAFEKHFQQACNKENKFLLWTRNKAKGLSGPALRDAKVKEKEKKIQEGQVQSKTSGKGGGGIFRRRGGPPETDTPGGVGDEEGSNAPYLTRSQSSSSSLMTMGGSSSGGMRTGRRATQDLLDYYSPGEEDSVAGGGAEYDDELLHFADDGDDYDEYDDDGQGPAHLRRKSSTTSSIVSMVSGGLAFFSRHHQSKTKPGAGQQQQQQQYSGALGTIFIRTIPSTGVQKYYRNCAVQTEPFPEEILVRLRLQFIHEEQQTGRLVLQQTPAQLQAAAQIQAAAQVQSQTQQLRHVTAIPLDKSASSPASGFPQLREASSSAGVIASATTSVLTGSLSPAGASTTASDSMQTSATAVAGPSSAASAPAAPDQTDKKSEESGYSSASISDTVMRYLRMARKSSKADNKEAIDKFKTVNYDRSLRYIKSKNVTVEEALEHEKNKALQAAQLKAGIVPDADKPPADQTTAAAVVVSPDVVAKTTTVAGSATPKAATTGPAGSTKPTGKAKPAVKGKKAKNVVGKKTGEKKSQDVTKEVVPELESQQAEMNPLSSNDLPSHSASGAPMAATHERNEESEHPHVRGAAATAADSRTSTPQTPLSPTSTSAPPSSMFSSRSGSGSSSVPPMSPPPHMLASTEMMLQGSLILSASGVTTGAGPILQSSSLSSIAAGPSMSPPPQQQQQLPGFPPPPTLVGIGIQAGESLVHLLKNYNPAMVTTRKFSDLSTTPSDYSAFLERYSHISAPGVPGAAAVQSSTSDSELFATTKASATAASIAQARHYFLHGEPSTMTTTTTGRVSASASAHAIPSSYTGGGSRTYSSIGVGTSSYDSAAANAAMQAKLRQIKSASTLTSAMKKAGTASQPMLLRIDDSSLSTGIRSPCPSPGNISNTSSTSSPGGILISGGNYGPGSTRSFPTLATGSSTSVSASRHQHHSALGLYPSQSAIGVDQASSSTSLGIEGSGSRRGKKHSTLTWATTASSSPSMSASLPVVSLASSSYGGRSSSDAPAVVGSSSRPHTTSPSNYSSLTSSASHFLSSFRSGRRKGGGAASAGAGASESGASASTGSYFGLGSSDKKQKHLSPSPSSSAVAQMLTRGEKGTAVDTYSPFDSASTALVMQKSKSSSSVFHHVTGSRGSTDAGGGSGEKRGSTASTSSVILPGTTVPAGQPHMSAGSRLMSKTRLFKSRSKSQSRVSSAGTCTWAPQGKCKWTSLNGRQITLQPTTVLHLNETERTTLQKVALAKLQALNLDVEIKIPKEKPSGTLQKPKRRPYLLKKKALSTGFFESGAGKEGTGKEIGAGSGSGMVFGVSLSQCVANDKKLQEQQQQLDQANRVSPRDWEQNIPPHATSTTTIKRSQNGSRNSVSSVFEGTPGPGVAGKEEKTQSRGSSDSLCWAPKRGSNAALDSLSSSSGDLLADQNIPSIDTSPIGSVPIIVTSCIKHLENYGLHTTGIFRVSTSLKRIRQLREEIDSGKVSEFTEEHSPHDIAALLKEFLRDLPEPLLSRELYQAFLRTQKLRNRRQQLEAVQNLIQLLPVANRDTLVSLLKFFAKVVENASDKRGKTGELLTGNKMEAFNLATLIAPNILPCMPTEGMSGSSVDPNSVASRERRESIDVVNYMISNYRELFEVTSELLDEVYTHMMDTHPDVVDGILKQKSGQTDDLDELETSSVFEGSECGEPADVETIGLSSVSKKMLPRREDVVHKESGIDGQGMRSEKKSRHYHHRSHYASKDSDLDKQQSGGESDSSSTKSATRWFRRAKHGSDHSAKTRTSSDSGSEQPGKGKKYMEQHLQQHRRKDSASLQESKRANSLDSVSLKESGPVNVITLTQEIFNPHLAQNLLVPDNANRRQSSPVLDSAGIIKASLKIPVPMPVSIDDTDIPFIEDDNNEVIQQQLHHHHHILRAHQPQLISIERGRSGSTESAGLFRQSTNNTPGSSQAASPLSTPLRQPSSEASSPSVLSPPMSPSDDPSTFPYEELTARFCIGAAATREAATSSSGSTSSSLHSGTTVVSKVPNTKASVKKSTETMTGPLEIQRTSIPTKSQLASPTLPPNPASVSTVTPSEIKAVGKEIKGANIAGLIRSKTADFEKIAKESQAPASSTQPSKIASSMRLRSQGNIQLKQQFLLRQQEKQSVPAPSSSNTGHAIARSATDLKQSSQVKSCQPCSGEPSPVTGSKSTVQHTPARWKRSEIISSRQAGSN